jgi:hypothetical protein
MPQAKISINSVVGSNIALPLNTLVQLDNVNSGGETTYTWSILDQPPGTVNALSSISAQNPSFTPTKEGTYLIRLVVNQGQVTEQEDRVVAAVLQLKTLERIPAAGETTEGDTADGWATSTNSYLRRIDALLSDPGIFVGVNASGGTLARGDVLRATASSVIKSGLPGQETVPGFSKALANLLANIDEPLVVCEGTVAGGSSVANGALMRVRFLGRFAANTGGGTAVVGAPVFVSDTGTLSLAAGTVLRKVGSAMTAGTTYDVWFAGMGGEDITPIDRAYVVYGAPGTLTNALRVDGITNAGSVSGGLAWALKTGDTTTVTQILRRFSAAGLAMTQWQSEAGVVLAQILNSGNLRLSSFFDVEAGAFSGSTMRIGGSDVATDGALQVRIKGADSWRFETEANVRDLLAPGSNATNVINIRVPGTFNEAARRNYVDVQRQNLIINGHMGIWQRPGVGAGINVLNNQRRYLADRWYVAVTNTAGNSADYTRTTISGPPNHFRFAARVTRFVGGTGVAARFLSQELDRELVRLLRNEPGGGGRTVAVQFWCRRGADFSGTLACELVRDTTLGGVATQNAFTGYTGGNSVSSFAVAPTTNWVRYSGTFVSVAATTACLRFNHTPSGTAGANDWFEVTGVTLVQADSATDFAGAVPFTLCGGSEEAERTLCERYYEKSYDIAVEPATASARGAVKLVYSATSFAGNLTYSGGFVFRTRKWTPYDGAVGHACLVYSPNTGTLDRVYTGAADKAVDYETGDNGETGFTIFNNDGSPPATNSAVKAHYIADFEI